MVKKLVFALVAGGIVFSASACNTVKGAGEDIESVRPETTPSIERTAGAWRRGAIAAASHCSGLRLCSGHPLGNKAMVRKFVLLFIAGGLVMGSAACNTVRGVGQDLESAANSVDKAT